MNQLHHLTQLTMMHSFYDVKAKEKVQTEVTGKVVYGESGKERYAFKAKSASGGNLTAFVSKETWDQCDAPVVQ